MRVSDEQIEAFRRDGAVCVRGAFTAEEVALVERGIERNLADPSPRALVASRSDDTGRFVEDFCNWDRIGEYERCSWYTAGTGTFSPLPGAQPTVGEVGAEERVD